MTETGGGALSIENPSTTTISNSSFTNNSALIEGGAVYLKSGSVVTMTNTSFTSNTAQEAGAIYIEDGDLDLNNVTLTSNSSTYGGGGVRVLNSQH